MVETENLYAMTLSDKNHKREPYLYIKNKLGLIALIQLGVLEIHPWASQIDKIEKPDFITFDLDPGSDTEWKKVVETAFLIKEYLQKINLHSFVKRLAVRGYMSLSPLSGFIVGKK